MKTIHDIRLSTGLSMAEFSRRLGIPYRTVQNWELGARKCPDYVVELIAYRVRTDQKFKE